MRNIIQYALRGFGARIGWVLAGLFLLALGIDARAATSPTNSCPSGKVGSWSVFALSVPNSSFSGCQVGDGPLIGDAPTAQMIEACRLPHGSQGPTNNTHWADEDWIVNYSLTGAGGQQGVVEGKSHLSGHQTFGNSDDMAIWRRTCIDPPPPACPEYGTPVENANYFRGVAAVSSAVEVNGQWCEVSGVGGVCVTVPGQGTYCPKWQYTGNPSADPGSSVSSEPRPEINNRVCSADGKYCVGTETASNCGTYQGEYVCLNSPAAGNCITTPKGNTVCTASPSAPLTTPPAPESPTNPGQVATPAGTVAKPDGNGGIVNNTTTVVFNEGGAETPGGEGTPTGEPDETPTEEPGDGEPCGAPDQPVCDVQIDEEGVEDIGGTFGTDLEQATAEAEAAELAALNDLVATVGPEGVNNPASGWGIGSLFPSMETGSCQTVSIEFFGGTAKTFPPPILCDFLDGILKPALGYFFALLLMFSVITGAIKTMSPGAPR